MTSPAKPGTLTTTGTFFRIQRDEAGQPITLATGTTCTVHCTNCGDVPTRNDPMGLLEAKYACPQCGRKFK